MNQMPAIPAAFANAATWDGKALFNGWCSLLGSRTRLGKSLCHFVVLNSAGLGNRRREDASPHHQKTVPYHLNITETP